jgi:hypothetical protein
MLWWSDLRRRSVGGAPVGDVVLAGCLAVVAFADTFFVHEFAGLDQWRGRGPSTPWWYRSRRSP